MSSCGAGAARSTQCANDFRAIARPIRARSHRSNARLTSTGVNLNQIHARNR
ncbi:hypothetical protein LC55x_4628 [Lysobacter capsici]|nr:hypothetical protein LC55x_4628 [Lysobacter capsici]